MKERIDAVSRAIWATLLAALVVILVGIPVGDNGRTMAVLDEVQSFREGFPREKLEQLLLGQASAQGIVQPAAAMAAARSEGVPKLTLGKDAKVITPRATLELGTLQAVESLSRPGAELEIASPDVKTIGQALAWRLARMGGAGYELLSLELAPGSSKPEEAKREHDTNAARLTLLAAEATLAERTATHQADHDLWEARRKWKAHWRMIQKANEKRLEARRDMANAEKARDEKRAAYEKLAEAALKFEGGAAGAAEGGLVVATLRGSGGDGEKPTTIAMPVPLSRRSVPVGHLQNAGFARAKELGMWEEIGPLTADQAIALLGSRFSWHYAHVELGGFKVGGMTVLQLAPLLVLILLRRIRRRATGVEDSYNPFDRNSEVDLPRVGLGGGTTNTIALIGLPLLGCMLCAWSLLQIGHVPVVPVLSGLAVIALGLFTQGALGELAELREAVKRSHSQAPPAPSKS